MKKLAGVKPSFSSLENQQLANLNAVTGGLLAGGDGGRSYVQSNLTNEQGCQDMDIYDANGKWEGRRWCVVV